MKEEEARALVYRVLGPPGPETDLEKSGRGTAFLLDESHLITCGHVVAAAVGRGLNDGTWLTADIKPGTKLRVQEADPNATPVDAVLEFYRPHQPTDLTADMAILRLEADTGGAVLFSPGTPENGTPLRAWGFPSGHKRTGGWVNLTTSGPDAVGWLQVDKAKLSGLPLAPGISGAPVWLADLSAAVGMITMADEKSGVAHIIPYEGIGRSAEELRCLPRLSASAEEVFDSLLHLDFQPQLKYPVKIAGAAHSAILVHGADEYGHSMLTERIKRRNKFQNADVLNVPLGGVILRPAEDDVYYGIARELAIDPEKAIQQHQLVRQALANRLRYKDIVIRFLSGTQTYGQIIDKVIKEFWQPLVTELKASKVVQKRLLVLILDKFGVRKGWGQLDVAQTHQAWCPEKPLELPELLSIDEVTLGDWLSETATPFLESSTVQMAAHLLYEQSQNGIPERVFRHYCRMRGLSWSELCDVCRWLND